MKAVIGLAMLVGCELVRVVPGVEVDDSAPADETGPGLDSGERETGGGELTRTWTLERVAEGELTGLVDAEAALVAPGTGWTYILDADGETIWNVTNGYVAPEGDYCLGGTGDDCLDGTAWTSGRVVPANRASAMCLDDAGGRLFVVQGTVSKLEVVDVAFEGPVAYSWNRATSLAKVPASLAAEGDWSGPCAVRASDGALAISSRDLKRVALLDPTSDPTIWELRTQSGDLGPVDRLEALDSGAFVAVDLDGGVVKLLSADDLSSTVSVALPGTALDVAVEPATGRVWVALAEAGVVVDLLDEAPEVASVALSGVPGAVAADPSTGLAVVAAEGAAGGWTLQLTDGVEVLARAELDGPVQAIARPAATGDLVVLQHGEAGSTFAVYDPVSDPPPDLPPLYAFLFSSIEEPFDVDIDKPCEGEGSESFAHQADLIEANAGILAGLGVPVAVGVTSNFVVTADRCGRMDLIETLQGYGFELGAMVHKKPGYNCTDVEVDGLVADTCARSSPFWCDPTRSSCTFPGDEGYCGTGDWECYLAYQNRYLPELDAALGGAAFVMGADRHGMWGWDWARMYREVDRADGTTGFDVTLFAHDWAYADEVSYDDARGKNPAPWRLEDGVGAWALLNAETWTVDSAFSDLLYLPGLNTSTAKLWDWHHSGLFLVDYFDLDSSLTYSEGDFGVLTASLRGSLNARTAFEPNTWYFHIHDMSLANLTDGAGGEGAGAEALGAWLLTAPATAEADGLLVWRLPSEIRATFPPR